jgi:hypothetical protein
VGPLHMAECWYSSGDVTIAQHVVLGGWRISNRVPAGTIERWRMGFNVPCGTPQTSAFPSTDVLELINRPCRTKTGSSPPAKSIGFTRFFATADRINCIASR